eukprot:6147213-Karenia_brevis.AAC.1
MLRKMLGSGRKVVTEVESKGEESDTSNSNDESDDNNDEHAVMKESWTEWIMRTTHLAEAIAQKIGIRDWLEEHFRRKWCWAGHTQRRQDG